MDTYQIGILMFFVIVCIIVILFVHYQSEARRKVEVRCRQNECRYNHWGNCTRDKIHIYKQTDETTYCNDNIQR